MNPVTNEMTEWLIETINMKNMVLMPTEQVSEFMIEPTGFNVNDFSKDISRDELNTELESLGAVEAATYDFGGDGFGIQPDEYFTRDELNEFCYNLEDDLSEDYKVRVTTYDAYIEDTTHFHIAMDVDNGYIVETDFTVDFRKIKKPDDLYKYYQPAYNDLAEQIEEYERY